MRGQGILDFGFWILDWVRQRRPTLRSHCPCRQSKIQTPRGHPKSKILSLALLAAVASPALARDAVALLRRGDRAERASRYAGVKQIWACCPGAGRPGPDY